MIIANARVVADDTVIPTGWVHVDRTRIAAIGSAAPPYPADLDLGGAWLTSGFVDIHCHGAAGHSFDEASDEAVDAIVRHHRAHGTTRLLASLVSAPIADLVRRLRTLAPRVADGTLLGIHLEGPFLSHIRCGSHAPEHLRPPTAAAVAELLAAGGSALRMITIAPELPGALEAIEQITAAGVVAAIGHTDADYEAVRAAVNAGARVGTHLYNGMPPVLGRAPGPVSALAHDPRVVVELIADGFHLHPATIRHAAATASGRFCLITDAMAATGVGDGDYRLGSQRVRVVGGQARLIDGDSLAGSTLTLDRALHTAVESGVRLAEALRAASSTPARAIGQAEVAGSIEVGRVADLVALDDRLAVVAVFHRGEMVAPIGAPSKGAG